MRPMPFISPMTDLSEWQLTFALGPRGRPGFQEEPMTVLQFARRNRAEFESLGRGAVFLAVSAVAFFGALALLSALLY